MLPPPSGFEDLEVEPYDVPRGTCPRCGSGNVRHLVAGVRGAPEWTEGSTPDWVDGVGCCLPLENRECDQCGWAWPDHEL
jgi:hypothetical protein